MQSIRSIIIISLVGVGFGSGNGAARAGSFLQMELIGTYNSGNGSTGSEIPAYDSGSKRVFSVNAATKSVDVIDLSDPTAPVKVGTLDLAGLGLTGVPNSVTVKNGVVAVAVEDQTKQNPGRVAFFNAGSSASLSVVTVGSLPDMVTFSPDGKKVIVANEGEPNNYNANNVDPEGSVSVIDVSGGFAGLTQANVTQVGFTSFNGQEAALRAQGVRIFGPNASAAQDFEPEYVTVSADSTKAYVTLQENNALAVIDLATNTVELVKSFGAKDHSIAGNGLDASDRDGPGGTGAINIQTAPVKGLYMPDAIASYEVDGKTYLVTANEGDARDYAGFNEEIRVGANGYVLDPTVFPDAAALKQQSNLGRLTVTRTLGNTDADSQFEEIYTFGARSFSIWDEFGNLVSDTGDDFEQLLAVLAPETFNSDGTPSTFDTRSDNKGPEPEGVAMGLLGGRSVAFIGLERAGGIMAYDVSDPLAPLFLEYINPNRSEPGLHLAPEGLIFVDAASSPTGKALLIVSNEVSGTISVFSVSFVPEPTGLVSAGLGLVGVLCYVRRRRRSV